MKSYRNNLRFYYLDREVKLNKTEKEFIYELKKHVSFDEENYFSSRCCSGEIHKKMNCSDRAYYMAFRSLMSKGLINENVDGLALVKSKLEQYESKNGVIE